jgi:hypothetical protein
MAVGRRSCLACLAASLANLGPPSARAVRGAAELDAEYYLRSTLGLAAPKVASRPPKPPRQLNSDAAAALLSAVTAQVAAIRDQTTESIAAAAAAQGPRLAIELDRALSSGLFSDGGYSSLEASGAATAPLTNEFAFDLRLFSLFSLVADGSLRRDGKRTAFFDELGDRLLAALPPALLPSASTGAGVVQAAAGCRRLLEHLRAVGYVTGFDFDAEDADDALWAQRSDLSATLLRATLYEPAALRSALLLSQRAGGMSSDLAAPLLAAYLRRASGAVVTCNQYFVDEYRDNPFDYRPSQLILELSLMPA